MLAAQQRMSERELKRREITGSLSANTVALAIKAMGITDDSPFSSMTSLEQKTDRLIGFVVEGNSKYFTLPKLFDMPVTTSQAACEYNHRYQRHNRIANQIYNFNRQGRKYVNKLEISASIFHIESHTRLLDYLRNIFQSVSEATNQ